MTEIKKNSAAFKRQRHALTAPQQKAFMNHLCNNYEFHGWEPVITVLLGTGIIESFGTGIGEAKRALENNGSPELFYKVFDTTYNVTSVVILVSEEYQAIKKGRNPTKNLGLMVKPKILNKKYWVLTIRK